MDLSGHIHHVLIVVNALAAVACVLLCVEYIMIVRVRKSPYPWSSYSVSFILFALACDRLLKMWHWQETYTVWQLASQMSLNVLVLAAAIMIPAVRRATYKRPRFNQLQQINEHLEYSQRLLRNYLDEAPVLAYIKDPNRKVTHASAGFARLFGENKVKNIIGETDLWGEPEASRARDMLILSGMEEGEGEKTETLELEDGVCTVLDIRFPLRGPEDESFIGGIAVDITNQLKRKNRIEVLASIVELCPDAMYSQDDSGRIQTWNPAAELMFGYSRKEMTGQSISVICAQNYEKELAQMTAALAEQPSTPYHFETVRVSKDGSKRTCLVAAALVPGEVPTIAVVTRDITKKKQVEEKIRALHEELERKVQDLSQSNIRLQKARDEALEAAGAKSTFVANASHELRTPLSGILGLAELLAGQSLDADSQRLIDHLRNSADELMQVIEDILDLAKLEAGKTTIEEEVFSLPELLEECQGQYRDALTAKGLTFQSIVESTVPVMICADRTAIKRIVTGLISNAISYTTSGGISIQLTMVHCDEANLTIKFSLTDTGCGIETSVLPLLFTPFARISPSHEGTPGKGLGLILARKLVSLLQGEIGCSSEQGKGSTFWFTALVHTAQADDPTKPRKDSSLAPALLPHQLAQCKVLSVDDSPIVSGLTIRQLNFIGVQASAAQSGAEAIEKASKDNFDVILMDIYLSDMTGYQAAKEIRKWERAQDRVPSVIIALTGCSPEELQEQADPGIMDDILEKPINIELLKSTLCRTLSQRPEVKNQDAE